MIFLAIISFLVALTCLYLFCIGGRTLHPVMQELKNADMEIFELSGIEPNPRIESVREGARLCKEHNIDTIRTSHYPPDPQLIEWCDQLGVYVVDEADIESMGLVFAERYIFPEDRKEFLKIWSSTATSMIPCSHGATSSL